MCPPNTAAFATAARHPGSSSAGRRVIAVAALLLALLLPAAARHAGAQPFESRLLRVLVSPGGEVSVEWRGAPGATGDWVSVVRAGTPDDVYESTWTYTDGRPAGVYNAGRFAPGDYEARIYFDWPRGGYLVVDRVLFRVGPPAGVVLAESPHLVVTLTPQGELIAGWRNTPGNAQDWVSVVRAGTADDVYESTWAYTEGAVSGSFNAGQLSPGRYEARLYLDWPAGGYAVVDCVAFQIGGAPPVPAPPSPPDPAPPSLPPAPLGPPPPAAGVSESALLRVTVTPARDVTVEWRGAPGTAGDWVSVVRFGTPDDVYEATWVYTGGLTTGRYPVGQLPPGVYEARIYFDWPNGGYTVRDRLRFSVP